VWQTYFLDGFRLSDGGLVDFDCWTHGGQVRKATSEYPSQTRPSCDAPAHDIVYLNVIHSGET